MTYPEIVETVLKLAYPNRMAQNLVALRKFHVQQGLIEIQRAVKCLQLRNLCTFGAEDITQNCWWTELPAPPGRITDVQVGPTEDNLACCCRPVRLDFVSNDMFDGLAGPYAGAVYGEIFWPVPRGWYSIYDERIVKIYPPVNSAGWQVNLKWNGIRKTWTEYDELDLEGWEDVLDALRLWVLYRGMPDEGCVDESMRAAHQMHTEAIRRLVYDCYNRQNGQKHTNFGSALPEDPVCAPPPCCATVTADAEPQGNPT